MEFAMAAVSAAREIAVPLLLAAAALAAVFAPVFLVRFAADRAATLRRKLSEPRGGKLIVTEDSQRLSPAVVPSSRPRSADRKSAPAFAALRALSAISGACGVLGAYLFPGNPLSIAALLAGFPGFLLLMAFESRYLANLKDLGTRDG